MNEIDRYMTAARGAVRRAAALTHRLLAFSRRQTLDPKPTDIDRLAAAARDLRAGRGVPLRRAWSSGLGPAIQLQIVFVAGRLHAGSCCLRSGQRLAEAQGCASRCCSPEHCKIAGAHR